MHRDSLWQKQIGATLIELLVLAGIDVVLGTVLLQLGRTVSNVMATINGQGQIQPQLTAAMDALTQDLRLAEGVDAGGAYTFSYNEDLDSTDDGHATLMLRLAAVDATGDPLMPRVFDGIIYDFDQTTGNLQRIVDAWDIAGSRRSVSPGLDDVHVVGRNISSIVFDGSVDNQLTIHLSASKAERGFLFQAPLVFTVKLRNDS